MSDLRMYAIVRGDIHMPPGKMAAQAGHAFVGAWDDATEDMKDAYGNGTKIVLVSNLAEILRLFEFLQHAEFPVVLIHDSNHILAPDFDGTPIITALGIGPISKEAGADLFGHLATY